MLDRPLTWISPVVQVSAAVFQALVVRLEEYWKVHTPSPAEEINTSRTLSRGVLALLFLGTRSPSSGLSRP